MTDERVSVIGNVADNSKRSNKSDNEDEREERIIGGGVTLPLTLVFSLLLTLNTLLITYRPLIVFTTSQNIQHSIVPINVATNINPISITYRLYNV